MTYVSAVFKTLAPYQIFFPLGMLLGLIGTSLWIAFAVKTHTSYPGAIHAEIMIQGFFFVIATGFLMTAVPKFSATSPASEREKMFFVGTTLLTIMTSLFTYRLPFHMLSFLHVIALALFFVRRMRKTSMKIPSSFVFVGGGMFSALLGTAIVLSHDFFETDLSLLRFAQLLLWYGVFLNFALGMGSRLIPYITGCNRISPNTPHTGHPFAPTTQDARERKIFFLLSLVLFLSFALEAYGTFLFATLLRSMVMTSYLLVWWRIDRFPTSKTSVSFALWISSWCIIAGTWLMTCFPSYRLHAAHLLFIGSLSIMIFAIATRVVLSHGSHGLKQERHSYALLFTFFFFLLALLTRLIAPWTQRYFQHLAYAAGVWIIGTLVWQKEFLKKIFQNGTE